MRFGLVKLREFARDTQGSTIIMVAVGLLMILGVASLSIDALYLYVLKDRLQTTADIAALAAVQDIEDEDQAIATAIEYVTRNMDTQDHGEVLSPADVVLGRWDTDARSFTPGGAPANAVQVTTRRDEANLSARSLDAFEPRRIELAMILDNSGPWTCSAAPCSTSSMLLISFWI